MRVFDFQNIGGDSGVSGFTITGGKTNAPVYTYTGDGGAFRLQNCSQFTISSCLITNNQCTDPGGAYGGAVYAVGSYVVVTNCLFRKNTANGSGNGLGFGGAVAGISGSQIFIDRCIMETNRAVGHPNSRGGSVYSASSPLHMRNCLVMRNDATLLGDGLFVTNTASTLIESCTIVANGGQGVNRGGTGSGIVSNSILWANGDDVAGTSWTIGYCDIEDGDNNGNNGCIQADPLFTDETAFNNRIERGSPCADSGWNQQWMFGSAYDLEGNIRKQGGRVDMGCYESRGLSGSVFMLR